MMYWFRLNADSEKIVFLRSSSVCLSKNIKTDNSFANERSEWVKKNEWIRMKNKKISNLMYFYQNILPEKGKIFKQSKCNTYKNSGTI